MSEQGNGDRFKVLKTLVRLTLGFTFLWSFIDKLFGLGYATTADKAWTTGVSPTYGFLTYASSGPFADLYKTIAGDPIVDIVFMAMLLFVGVSLMLGIFVKIGGYTGAVLMILIWTATLFPEHNPFIDEHVIYALVLIWLTRTNVTKQFGLGKWWQQLGFVKKYSWLQ